MSIEDESPEETKAREEKYWAHQAEVRSEHHPSRGPCNSPCARHLRAWHLGTGARVSCICVTRCSVRPQLAKKLTPIEKSIADTTAYIKDKQGNDPMYVPPAS